MTKKLVLDPGHGGKDPGAVGNGLRESDLTLKIVNYAAAYLKANYTGLEIKQTRTSDATVELGKRDDVANNWGADLFVSVHINAGGGTGYESYIYPKAGAETKNLQVTLNNEILSTMKQFGNIKEHGNMNKAADLSVVRETRCLAVLTENLFIDSNDATYLKNAAFLKAVGEAHARGIAKYLKLSKKNGGTSVTKPKDDIQGHWAEVEIKQMKELKILNGYPDGTFKPDNPVTKAELSAFGSRLLEEVDKRIKGAKK